MFRKKRYTFLFVIIALCFLAFSFFRLLPVTFSRGIPVAEEIETPDTYGGENLKDYPGGEDPGEINTPEQIPEASSGSPGRPLLHRRKKADLPLRVIEPSSSS